MPILVTPILVTNVAFGVAVCYPQFVESVAMALADRLKPHHPSRGFARSDGISRIPRFLNLEYWSEPCELTPSESDGKDAAGENKLPNWKRLQRMASEPATLPEREFRRIVVLHLDSLNCLPGLDILFSALGARIGLVVSSDRFAGNLGGMWRQLERNRLRSGVHLTVALGFDIVALRIARLFAPMMRVVGRHSRLLSLAEHARSVGASYVVSADVNGSEILSMVRNFRPDLIVSFHFDQILRPAFLEAAGAPVLNVHPALLPAHRGPCPSFWCLAAQETRCGVTIHRVVDATIDTGEPVVRRARAMPSNVSMGELDEILFIDGAKALAALLAPQSGVARRESPGSSGPYESLPPRHVVREARKRGVRLWRLGQSVRLLAGLFGWTRR